MTYDPRRENLFDQCKTRAQLDARPARTRWLNIFAGTRNACHYDTREEADRDPTWARLPRIACIRVTYIDGEGLQ